MLVCNVCRAEMCKLETSWSLLAKSENKSAFSLLINAACPIWLQEKKPHQSLLEKALDWEPRELGAIPFYYLVQDPQ